MTLDRRLREMANETASGNKIIRDGRTVDVGRWGIPEDSHLLRSPAAFLDDVQELFRDTSCKGDRMPSIKTHGLMQFRPGEVSLWVGYKESYKSTFINELVTSWACRGLNVAVASLEMPAPILLKKTVQQALAKQGPDRASVEKAVEHLSNSMTIYDVTGRVPPKHLLAIMRYCAVELECRHFVLDNLTMILSTSNERTEEHQSFVADCTTISRTTGMHIHLVAHCTKPEGGDEGKIPNGYNARGTGAAPDMVDNLLVVWRNKPKETKIDNGEDDDDVRKQPDVMVVVDKQRHWDYRGTFKFWIDRRSLRFREFGNSECLPFL